MTFAASILTRGSIVLHWLRVAVASVADFDQVLKSQTTVKTRAEIERIMMTALMGELIGASLAPPDLSLRLLPFFVPHVYQWRRAASGLYDFSDQINAGC